MWRRLRTTTQQDELYYRAERAFQEALQICSAFYLRDIELLDVLFVYGDGLRAMGQPLKGLELLEEAVRLMREQSPESFRRIRALVKAGETRNVLGDIDAAVSHLKEAWLIICNSAESNTLDFATKFIDSTTEVKNQLTALLEKQNLLDELLTVLNEYRSILLRRVLAARGDSNRSNGRTQAAGYVRLNPALSESMFLQNVQEKAKDGEVVLLLDSSPDRSRMWCITSKHWYVESIDHEQLKEQISKCSSIRDDLLKYGTASASYAQPHAEWYSVGIELTTVLLSDKMAREVALAQHVIVCPDVDCWQLLFSLLVIDGAFLSTLKSWALVPSLWALWEELPEPEGKIEVTALVAGSNVFRRSQRPKDRLALQHRSQSAVRSRVSAGETPQKLQFALKEAKFVGKLYSSILLVSKDFKRASVRKVAPTVDIVHIASHGFSKVGSFGETGVIDADCKPIIAKHLVRAKASPKVVVLSACSSGHGESLPGAGLLTCSYHLMLAGCKASIVNGVPVDDRSCARLTCGFHRAFASKGKSVSEAFCSAVSAERDRPVVWCCFFVFGLGRFRL